MARYDRRFLVPYLEDVCSVELLYTRAARDLDKCKYALSTARRNAARTAEAVKKPSLLGRLSWILCGIVIIAILAVLVDKLIFPPLLFILIVGVFGGGTIGYLWTTRGDYSLEMSKYKHYLTMQATYDRERAAHEAMVKMQEKKKVQLENRFDSVEELRKRVYSVNVIPGKYRNLHAAYYLFDYFNTCNEDDLDRVIQTMLLDDIIQRLDKIIEQQEEMLLNQRYQIALQKQQNRMAAENHRMQMEAIARMESNQQRQIDYQQMMVQNQAVTNFFLTYDFLTKKR